MCADALRKVASASVTYDIASGNCENGLTTCNIAHTLHDFAPLTSEIAPGTRRTASSTCNVALAALDAAPNASDIPSRVSAIGHASLTSGPPPAQSPRPPAPSPSSTAHSPGTTHRGHPVIAQSPAVRASFPQSKTPRG